MGGEILKRFASKRESRTEKNEGERARVCPRRAEDLNLCIHFLTAIEASIHAAAGENLEPVARRKGETSIAPAQTRWARRAFSKSVCDSAAGARTNTSPRLRARALKVIMESDIDGTHITSDRQAT